MKNITDKYKNMISAFSADLELATDFPLVELQQMIDEREEVVMKDIELLSELEYLIRHNQVRIMEMNKTDYENPDSDNIH